MLVRFILSKADYNFILYRDVELNHFPVVGIEYQLLFDKDPEKKVRCVEVKRLSYAIDRTILTQAVEIVEDKPLPELYLYVEDQGVINIMPAINWPKEKQQLVKEMSHPNIAALNLYFGRIIRDELVYVKENGYWYRFGIITRVDYAHGVSCEIIINHVKPTPVNLKKEDLECLTSFKDLCKSHQPTPIEIKFTEM